MRTRNLLVLVWALLSVVAVVALSSGASAQTDTYVGGTTSTTDASIGPATTAVVQPNVIEATTTSTGGAVVQGVSTSRGLALTGADVLGLAAIGGIAVAVGVPLVRASRARRGH